MSSIRLYILGSLAQRGEMHGHQLRLLAEEEHLHHWTDITVGSLYGAIKRMAAEGLIDVVRVEREGNFPERQIYAISDSGREALASIRHEQLTEVTFRADPFDLALTRLDGDRLDALEHTLDIRCRALEALLADAEEANARALPHLTLSETFAMNHREHRIRSELEWHRELMSHVPDIISDERERNAGGRAPLPTTSPKHHAANPPDAHSDPRRSDLQHPDLQHPDLQHLPDTPPRKASYHV